MEVTITEKQQLLEKFANFLIKEAVQEQLHHQGQAIPYIADNYQTLCSIMADYDGVALPDFNATVNVLVKAEKIKGGAL